MKLYSEIEKKFVDIKNILGYQGVMSFLKTDYADLNSYHFNLGLWIRNNVVQIDSVLYRQFIDSGIVSHDDMSMFILQLFYIYLHEG